MNPIEILRIVLTVMIPAAIGGLGGSIIGHWWASRREQFARKHTYMERQLTQFYAPLVGIREEILAKSQLRARISTDSGAAWSEFLEGLPEGAVNDTTATRAAEFDKITEYNNRQLVEDILPGYRQMRQVFRDNIWLAEPSTRKYYGDLVKFIDVCDRWLSQSLPAEVAERLQHGEESLQPFYRDLSEKLDTLRSKLAQR